MPLDQFLQRRVFAPLGMTDTVFFVDPARASRLAVLYRKGEDGKLVATRPVYSGKLLSKMTWAKAPP